MLRLTEVASQSVTFVKPALSKAKTNTLNSLNEWLAPAGHYPVVFSLDRPPLLAVVRRSSITWRRRNTLLHRIYLRSSDSATSGSPDQAAILPPLPTDKMRLSWNLQ